MRDHVYDRVNYGSRFIGTGFFTQVPINLQIEKYNISTGCVTRLRDICSQGNGSCYH